MASKRFILAETIKGGLGVLQGLVSHPAGLAALGLVFAPVGIGIVGYLEETVKPQTTKGKLLWETYLQTFKRVWPFPLKLLEGR